MKKVLITILILIIILAVVWFLFFNKNQETGETHSSASVQTEDMQEEIPTLPKAFEHDKDRDGISDEEEEKLGTSDYEFDTDGDGLSDKTEIEKWKTDPTKRDTDGDGYGDAIEILSGYNPLGEGTL